MELSDRAATRHDCWVLWGDEFCHFPRQECLATGSDPQHKAHLRCLVGLREQANRTKEELLRLCSDLAGD